MPQYYSDLTAIPNRGETADPPAWWSAFENPEIKATMIALILSRLRSMNPESAPEPLLRAQFMELKTYAMVHDLPTQISNMQKPQQQLTDQSQQSDDY